ncbi:MAG: calcium-translocating P-type ATPase, SERCA-type [Candidatus Aminicenantes bacterium]|nr:calcium-translocating P-type ATPase, SERCA-type [Candidatus Aminicenantes bacterium]
MTTTRWWRLDPPALAGELKTDLTGGLTAEEAARRLASHGPNKLQEGKGRTPLGIFFEQFADFMIWVLIGAALVSGFLQEWVDAAAIIAIVILNAVLGFIQEHRAEKSLQALRRMAAPSARAVRDGIRLALPAGDLVPGDIIELEAGDHVPADARVSSHTANFAVQEAGLTGESTPVPKTLSALKEDDLPLGDRANMIFMGTAVVTGKARAVVVETGMGSELGKIAGMIQDIERETTPLQKRLEQFGKLIIYACFVLVGLVFVMGLLRGGKLLDMFLTAVSLAVAAIPEGMPAVVTIALALGVQRMVRRHVLIRKLPAVETLGCATVICSDKTGTLTKNEMTVRAVVTGRKTYQVTGAGYEPAGEFLLDGDRVDPAGEADLTAVLRGAVLCNGAELTVVEGRHRIVGDPTEGALLTCAAKAGLTKAGLEAESPFFEEIPFDSERKRMTILRRTGGGATAFVKGAPDVLLERCDSILENGSARPLGKADAAEILKANTALSEQALRVLGIARREFAAAPDVDDADGIESSLTFLGLAAMIDPPRDEAREAVAKCRASGIATVMITGDHKATAVAVARELGMATSDSLALTGEELDRLEESEFERRIDHTVVYARVAPEHKLRVVRAWRKKGAIVAMTGDGVNDAPAVKEADIGIAMGITGTDVTKEVSDMIITDDNFASIVAAVEEGRGIYDNIKKFIHYLLSCNTGEILVMFTSTLLGWPVPLLPIQILWVNLITDGLPALALGMDPVDPAIMERPPRRADEPIVDRVRARLMLAQGAFIALCSLLAFAFVLFVEKEGINRARTAALIALSAAQLFHAFNCRSQKTSLFKLGVFSNPKLLIANGASLVLQFAIIYIPFTQRIFKVEALGLVDVAVLLAISSFPLWAMEALKRVRRLRPYLPEA